MFRYLRVDVLGVELQAAALERLASEHGIREVLEISRRRVKDVPSANLATRAGTTEDEDFGRTKQWSWFDASG